ncbi:hypothetical protein [Dyadobacter sp. 676]|uniref:DUF4332 domain-containing protein n=1 Tax=Dyadobacter sp. 676 TaxID=3088362 RepID=A0AAU8FGL3_9BACT
MVLLDITPLSKPVAISEILILMIATTLIGWLIARWITNGRAQGLREQIAARETELDDCRSKRRRDSFADISNVAAPTRDNLKVIEGIGPKIEELLNKAGILTFGQLAQSDPVRIEDILRKNGSRYQIHDPASWAQQSALARDGKWEELKELQDKLDGGRTV